MQIVDANGNVFGTDSLQINGPDGKPKTTGGGGGGVTSVTATSPLASSGGTTPDISIPASNSVTNGYLSSTDWIAFNNKFNTPSGTTLQYVRGDGSLATFPTIPSITGLVPYTGATADVDLGTYNLKADALELSQTPTDTAGVAKMVWNDTDGTIEFKLKGGNVTLQVGQEQLTRVVNKTGANLLEADYHVVYVYGAQGQRLSVKNAKADSDATSAGTLGVVTENINNNQEGFITTSGLVHDINTTGSLQGETWADGDILYLSPTTAGYVTNVKPVAPYHTVTIGYCVYAHAIHGIIYVKVDNGYELGELHDVNTTISKTTPVDADNLLLQDSADSNIWKKLSWANLKATAKTYFDTLYQAVLVSGTNIKTINSTSLLGSGDVAVEPTISAGTTAQYWRGDKTWQNFPSIPSVTPSALTKTDDTNVTLTLGGSPSNALLQAVSLTLGWTGTLADSRIASASTWNAKQDAITLTTTGTSGAATLVGSTLNIPNYATGSTPVKLTSQTLSAASWSYSGGYYQYTFSNVNIDTTCDVSVTPQNASYMTAYSAQILPYIAVGSGSATFYSLFPAQADIVVDIVITQTV